MPLPLAGSGLLFIQGALMLGLGGVIGEMVYKLGDLRESEFSLLSAGISTRSDRSAVTGVVEHA